MKFGKVENASDIDFALPQDHPETEHIIRRAAYKGKPKIYVGCAKWNRQELKNFYPKGTKDELTYYATQFNAIEMNASFYRIFSEKQFETWQQKVPQDFRFFPKVFQGISHWKRLNGAELYVDEFTQAILRLEGNLGMPFLQMHENFSPKDENWTSLQNFLKDVWADGFPLALELRHTDWYNDENVAKNLYNLLEKQKITNIITDTAGRRDLLHMRLTTNTAFVRYVGANDKIKDYERAEDWVHRLKKWSDLGIEHIYFFVHQNVEEESVKISQFFIEKLNETLGTNLKAPMLKDEIHPKLF